jgi:transcriptional accessory protein Tex/SPT6
MYNGIDLNTAVGFYLNYNKQARQKTSKQVVNVVNKQQPVKSRKTLVPYSKNGKHGAVLIDIKDDWKSGHFIEIDL